MPFEMSVNDVRMEIKASYIFWRKDILDILESEHSKVSMENKN